MDVSGLVRMLTRMFLNKAVKAGIDFAARRGKAEAAMTSEERKQAKTDREMARRVKDISRITRRFLR